MVVSRGMYNLKIVFLILSIILQGIAAIFSFRLISITGMKLPWLMIAGAVCFMALRRGVSLMGAIFPSLVHFGGCVSEGISLVVSALIAVGMWFVASSLRRREELERKLAQKDRELLQAQKMEAMGLLAGGIAHDFNNLLTAIRGYAEIGLLRVKEKNIEECLFEVKQAALMGAHLTRQLLLFSSRHKGDGGVLSINNTVRGMVRMLERIIGEDIRLTMELAPKDLKVKMSAGNLEQVIMNLVVNARDAMPTGGEIVIRTEEVELGDANDRYVCLSIMDTGLGMDSATLKRIFEPFFTTKAKGKGTGLGLSVVHSIVADAGGDIEVYSEPGQGTVFKIYLPMVGIKGEEGLPKGVDVSVESLEGSGERILLVEDDELVRSFALKALSTHNYDVTAVGDPEDAIGLFDTSNKNFDLLVTDLMLPGMSGIVLAERLKSKNESLALLFCSGYPGNKERLEEIGGKGVQFLQKPYGIEDLLRAVRYALNRA